MTTSLRLYEAVDALETVRDWLDEHADDIAAVGGDLDRLPELAALLDQAEGEFAEKAERVALFIRERRLGAKAVREEAKRLAERADREDRTADALTQYLLLNMQRAETKKIEGKLVTIRVQQSPASVTSTLTDAEVYELYCTGVPENGRRLVRRVPERYELDKQAVRDAAILGQPIPAGVTVTRGSHVRIS